MDKGPARIVWNILKWVVFPAVFAMVGYFLLGPLIGTKNLVPPSLRDRIAQMDPAAKPPENKPEANEPDEPAANDAKDELEMEVEVQPSPGRRRR
jgi:hypothetical protein